MFALVSFRPGTQRPSASWPLELEGIKVIIEFLHLQDECGMHKDWET